MARGNHGLYHIQRRKRIHEQHEKFPHPNKWIRLLDNIVLVVGIIGPAMTIPQVLKIWLEQNAAGVSLISWSAYLILDLVWLLYGLVHKVKPIIISYLVWFILEVFLIAGILKYGTDLL